MIQSGTMTPDPVLTHLRVAGPRTGGELCVAISISPATLSRRMADLRSHVLVVGRARNTRYAARRIIDQVSSPIPVYELGLHAGAQIGALHPVTPGFYFESTLPIAGFYPDIPWFLNDLRPAGFLGRLVPRAHPDLRAPNDVALWSGDQMLRYLTKYGSDLAGNLVVGEPAFAASLAGSSPNRCAPSDRAEVYGEFATQVSAFGVPGSSAAGEQPKFLATVIDEAGPVGVLVKFSPVVYPGDRIGRRLADLLRLESLALAVTANAGIPAASSTIIEGSGRVFLEVRRFDRTGAFGRCGVVSFAALDDEFVGSRESWSATAEALLAQQKISPESCDRARWLDRFGAYIANSDRHHGNLSCFFEHGQIGELCPVYDMLPMGYAPTNNELVRRTFGAPAIEVSAPSITRSAWAAALTFWRQAAELPTIEAELRTICCDNAALLAEQAPMLDRLPAA